jgi:hypothetical protein
VSQFEVKPADLARTAGFGQNGHFRRQQNSQIDSDNELTQQLLAGSPWLAAGR